MSVGMERFGFQHPGVCAYCVAGVVDTPIDTGSCLEESH